MANIHDVAAYVLQQKGEMTTMRLQKLCYYSLAWHAVWEECALFEESFQAWANGPVCFPLYLGHRGRFTVAEWAQGRPSALTPEERASIDGVLKFYGDLSGQQLSEMTYREDPWRDARRGLAPGERGDKEIPLAHLHAFYDGLAAG